MIENQHRRQQRRAARILAEKFSFPLGLKQIPIRLDFARTHEFGVHRKSGGHNGAFEHEDIFVLRIGVPMLAAVPLRRVRDFGKNQRRRERIENLVEIEHARPVGPAGCQVGEIFIRAPLRDNPRHHVGGASARRDNFDERKFFAERGRNIWMRDLLSAIERELAFFLGRRRSSSAIRPATWAIPPALPNDTNTKVEIAT